MTKHLQIVIAVTISGLMAYPYCAQSQWLLTNAPLGHYRAFDIVGSYLFAGGGVFLSMDSGITWNDVTNNLRYSDRGNDLIAAIAFFDGSIFVGTANGVYQS